MRRLLASAGPVLDAAWLAATAVAAPTVLVTSGGRIGGLRVDRSDVRAIVAFAGRPDADRRGRDDSARPYRALGYECSATAADGLFPVVVAGPHCRTVFFLDSRTGRLGTFFTRSPRYAESHGVRIGMRTAVAERILRRVVIVGCEENVALATRGASLTVAFAGGRPRKTKHSTELHLVGGHVWGFVLHGGRNDVRVFDCM